MKGKTVSAREKPAPRRRGAPRARHGQVANTPREGPTGNSPLWLLLSEPGLSRLLTLELKHRDVLRQKTRTKVLYMRSYDLTIVPPVQVLSDFQGSRIIRSALRCPVFGRSRMSEAQLDLLASECARAGCRSFVSSVAGSHFQRQDFNRWVLKQIKERGVKLEAGPGRSQLWLIIVDDDYFFGFETFNHHQAPGRDREGDREASLPATTAAAMVFASHLGPQDVVWDPVVGSGVLLREAAYYRPQAFFIGTDIDPEAVNLAERRLANVQAPIDIRTGDARTIYLGRTDISLTLANLPWGKQFSVAEGNEAFYKAVLENSLRHASAKWRGCFLTSDETALRAAASGVAGAKMGAVTKTEVRGQSASICMVERR